MERWLSNDLFVRWLVGRVTVPPGNLNLICDEGSCASYFITITRYPLALQSIKQ
jgi:hypothetical protein